MEQSVGSLLEEAAPFDLLISQILFFSYFFGHLFDISFAQSEHLKEGPREPMSMSR